MRVGWGVRGGGLEIIPMWKRTCQNTAIQQAHTGNIAEFLYIYFFNTIPAKKKKKKNHRNWTSVIKPNTQLIATGYMGNSCAIPAREKRTKVSPFEETSSARVPSGARRFSSRGS